MSIRRGMYLQDVPRGNRIDLLMMTDADEKRKAALLLAADFTECPPYQ
jgi:hypothetical protein